MGDQFARSADEARGEVLRPIEVGQRLCLLVEGGI